MKCPIDNTELENRQYESIVNADICPSCSGMFLDKGELEIIEQTLTDNYKNNLSNLPDDIDEAYAMAKQKSAPAVTCPKCSTEMERKEYGYSSQIMIDRCPNCGGIWLNQNELQQIELFYEKTREDTAYMSDDDVFIKRNIHWKSFFKDLLDFYK
jgi:Zn-finger nucleic acid-binding protein